MGTHLGDRRSFQGTPEDIQWVERINRYAESDYDCERLGRYGVRDTGLQEGPATMDVTSLTEGVSLLTKAVDTARRVGDAEALWAVTPNYMIFTSALRHAEERLRLAEEVTKSPRTGVSLLSLSGRPRVFGLCFPRSRQTRPYRRDLARIPSHSQTNRASVPLR